MKTYKHFFYDFDGMIADTYPHVARALVRVLERTRGEKMDEGEAYDLLKINFAHTFKTLAVTPEEEAEFRALHVQWDFEPLPKLFPHIDEVIRETVARGNKCYIFTNRSESLHEYLKNLGLHEYFTDFILSAHKPSADKLSEMIDAYGLDRAECVVVGDRALDVESAKMAGVDGILFDNDGRVEEHCATHVITKIEELFQFI